MSIILRLTAVLFAACFASTASAATCSVKTVNFSLGGSSNSQCSYGSDIGKNGIVAQNKEMFGISGWILGETTSTNQEALKQSNAASGEVMFSSAPGFKQKSGEWAVDGSAGFGSLMIVLKAGRKMSAFLIDDLQELAGLWSIEREVCNRGVCKNVGFRLKHASIYYTPAIPEPAPVPVPAAGFMLLAGLAGLAGLRRARKAA